jgi:imidazole glycerol-phosphate synthase subunit HisH
VRPAIAILDYDSGNLRSVATAVHTVGGEPVITADPIEALRAAALIVPGVGAFGACVGSLRERGLDGAVVRAAMSGRPVLGVCVGMQVLFERSEESPGVPGLGLFPGTVRRLPGGVPVPHVGWNDVRWTGAHPLRAGLPDDVPFYFVHSYAVDAQPFSPKELLAAAEHGRTFAAAVGVGSVAAVQFHPERSGDAGLALYDAFVRSAR